MKLFRSNRIRLTVLLVVLSAAASAPSALSNHAVGGDLLPDLVTLEPSDLRIVNPKPHQRHLRFANTIANNHTGVLELTPVSEDCDGDGKARNDRSAYQRIYADGDGDGIFTRGTDTAFRSAKSGCFDFHPQHHHWHLENFAIYELRTLTGSVVASTEKVSFCIIDSFRKFTALPGSPGSKFFASCTRDGDQGLSVGWADVYSAATAGQHLVITGLADGTYCLVSTADPANQLVESDDSNNETAIRVALSGTTVSWLPYQTC